MTIRRLQPIRLLPLALVIASLAACSGSQNAAQPDGANDGETSAGTSADTSADTSGQASGDVSGEAAGEFAVADLVAAGLSAEAQAALSPESDMLTPVEYIKEAYDAGVDIVFVDARPELDYEFGHIPGAINVPYFEADEHLAELPRDRLIVSYCECPHAEAVQVADVLVADGFPQVKVIDEGLFGWTDLGGETVAGAPDTD